MENQLLLSLENVHLKRGDSLWVRGPNGAGKTTFLEKALRQLRSAPESIAYVPQLLNPQMHLPLHLGEVLELSASRKIDGPALRDFALLEPRHLRLSWNTASGGERMRTLVMAALLRSPDVLILDEPLNHLDTASRETVKKALRSHLMEKESRTLILVSHESIESVMPSGRTLHELRLSPR